LKNASLGITEVVIEKPAGRRWTVEPAADSSRLVQGIQADGTRPVTATAKVMGSGHDRRLAYTVKGLPAGSRVDFAEAGNGGGGLIGSVKADGAGTLKFQPAGGAPGKREIQGVVYAADGYLTSRLTLGSYTAPAPQRPARASKLTVRRVGKKLVLRWKGRPAAYTQQVDIRSATGLNLTRTVRRSTTSIALPAAKTKLVVAVTGRRGPGSPGRRALPHARAGGGQEASLEGVTHALDAGRDLGSPRHRGVSYSQRPERHPARRPVGEVAMLDDALRAASSAAGLSTVEIVGEAGIGKTTLLEWLGASASRAGRLVLSGRCSEFERDVPYALWIDALDAQLAAVPPGRGRPRGARVGVPGPAAHADGAVVERHQLHRAVRGLLERLAAPRGLVLLLDDLHWADPASIALVASLVRRPSSARVLLAVAHRHRQVGSRLDPELRRAAMTGVARRLAPGPLDGRAGGELLAGVVGEGEVGRLHAESGGNPFHLMALARAGRPVPGRDRDPGHAEVPETVARPC
jgi:hypothetical protein